MFPARTPERPDGHECRGKCGGRLHGLCGEADPDRDNPMQRVCHDCLAAKRYSKGKGNAVKPQVERRKASDTGGVGAGPWKNAKSVTDNTDVMEAMQLDAADVMTEALKGTHVNKVNAVDIEDSDDDTAWHGGGAPRPTWNFVALRFSGERSGGVRQ